MAPSISEDAEENQVLKHGRNTWNKTFIIKVYKFVSAGKSKYRGLKREGNTSFLYWE